MTPAERLKEIEDKHVAFTRNGELMLTPDDKDWLIARVRKLTEALEVIGEKHENEASSELYLSTWQRLIREIARKAIDDE